MENTQTLWTRENAIQRLKEINGKLEKIDEWNNYRKHHTQWGKKDYGPVLSTGDTPAELANLKLAFKDEVGLWHGIDLSGLQLFAARFTGSDLHGADLSRAVLSHARMENVQLKFANLTDANLRDAHLQSVSLYRAKVHGADFRGADLRDAHVFEINYNKRTMLGCYLGVQGLDSCYGDAFFRRDAIDQDYIDTVRFHANNLPKKLLFLTWKLFDYGRSWSRVIFLALAAAVTFGVLYWLDWKFGWGLLDYSRSANTSLTPIYYSIVTYTTLGFGDVTPEHWIGELLIMMEVILGYITLGLFLAILANKVARRA
ncbi:MAG: pentapeptide repeat-containing protein [candidate division Zixibacteria bacterium]|nr:pentapeptide repeat-containing protein [candidate division Zixibacteria bacterium]